MGYSKLVPRVLGYKSKMAAHKSVKKCDFHKRTQLFYRSLLNLETCHRLESIQKSFLGAYCYLKGFLSYGGGK